MAQRGGARIGAGRKPKPKIGFELARLLKHPSSVPVSAPVGPVEVFDPPPDLTAEERRVWELQAPHAFAQRTLTRASAFAFARYCQVAVLEQHEAKSSGMGGANHRGLLKQLSTYEVQFLLAPAAKPMVAPVTPVVADEDDRFFGSR